MAQPATRKETARTQKTGGRSAPGKRGRGRNAGAEVCVRMYQQGLGDCFLITLPGEHGPFHVLLDCGVVLGTQNPKPLMRQVAESIRDTVGEGGMGPPRLDVVVATHEHWDHLSGFLQAQEVFDEIEVGQVWFAWTEDPSNTLATTLRQERRERIRQLRLAFQQMADTGFRAPSAAALGELLNLFGEEAAGGDGPGARTGSTTSAALEYLARRRRSEIRYLYPGREPITLKEVPGVRIYVLGPPLEEASLRRSNPSRRRSEVYEQTQALTPEHCFFAGLAGGLGQEEQRLRAQPFEDYYRIPAEEVKSKPQVHGFFHQHYGFPDAGNTGDAWRRIDSDWLSVAGELALKLDSDTNNTSLVLAIELVRSGRVLLFPADAQVGNWTSWGSLSWSLEDERGQTRPVTAADLLRRTVLYKVGHHASHNATLREQGLELMESPELVALVPVDHEIAVRKRWNMPFPPLLKRLQEKARGRVIRLDEGVPSRAELSKHLTEGECEAFERAVDAGPPWKPPAPGGRSLYIDYRVEM